MAKKDEKNIVEREEAGLPVAIDFYDDAEAGMEGADSQSFAIPFLSILQELSPQCDRKHGIEGAVPGLYINTITNEMFESVSVIPCAFRRVYNRWVPRKQGGGFKGSYPAIEVDQNKIPGIIRDGNKLTIEDDELRDTRMHYVLAQSASGQWFPAVISFAGTQIKKSKNWMAMINGIEKTAPNGKVFIPPSFSHIYEFTSKEESNNQGRWSGFVIRNRGEVTDLSIYQKAKEFNKSVLAGQVIVQEPETEGSDDDNGAF